MARRPEGRNAKRRQEALEREQAATAAARAERARRRRTAWLSLGLILVVVVAGGAFLVVKDRQAAALDRRLVAGDCTRDQRADPTRGGGHVAAPTYSVQPPAGGDHLVDVARAGIFVASKAPADGLLVHALEHGYVVLWYASSLPAGDVEQLVNLTDRHDGDVILVERPQLAAGVAATAWEQRLLCPGVEPDALEAFVERFVGAAPEDVDRG